MVIAGVAVPYMKGGNKMLILLEGGELNQLSVGYVMDILEELAVSVFRVEMSEYTWDLNSVPAVS